MNETHTYHTAHYHFKWRLLFPFITILIRTKSWTTFQQDQHKNWKNCFKWERKITAMHNLSLSWFSLSFNLLLIWFFLFFVCLFRHLCGCAIINIRCKSSHLNKIALYCSCCLLFHVSATKDINFFVFLILCASIIVIVCCAALCACFLFCSVQLSSWKQIISIFNIHDEKCGWI